MFHTHRHLLAKNVFYMENFMTSSPESKSHSVMSNSLETAWTIQSMGFSRPEYQTG